MNALFGDATTAMATPVSRAADSIRGESVDSLRIGEHGADMAVPGLDIEPPSVTIKDGRPILSRQNSDASSIMSTIREEGLGGWISNMVQRNGKDSENGGSGKYKRVGEGDDV